MFEAIGHPVIKLKREQYGFLTLDGLTAGDSRELTPHEVKLMRTLASTEPKQRRM
ncbi:16S rRNA U516 pseudouridylate synthase RsuA-like enzyme [Peribacillus simplex]|nr:16S rRNA U516 pseudouridylate synthase RsuA-like enzyme [Peribacillus simplex]